MIQTPTIPGLDRWRAWEEGEEHGRRRATAHAIRVVLEARGLRLDAPARASLEAIDDPWRLEQLLAAAATVTPLESWTGLLRG